MEVNRIELDIYKRYVDDINIVLKILRVGFMFMEDGVVCEGCVLG